MSGRKEYVKKIFPNFAIPNTIIFIQDMNYLWICADVKERKLFLK